MFEPCTGPSAGRWDDSADKAESGKTVTRLKAFKGIIWHWGSSSRCSPIHNNNKPLSNVMSKTYIYSFRFLAKRKTCRTGGWWNCKNKLFWGLHVRINHSKLDNFNGSFRGLLWNYTNSPKLSYKIPFCPPRSHWISQPPDLFVRLLYPLSAESC